MLNRCNPMIQPLIPMIPPNPMIEPLDPMTHLT
jgi:hypothetical protein